MKRIMLPVALTSVVLLSMAGCSANGSGESILPNNLGFSFTAMDPVDLQQSLKTNASGNYYTLEDSANIEVFIAGSSTCPAVIDKVVEDKNNVKLVLKENSGACTKDLTYQGYRVTALIAGFDFTQKQVFVCNTETCSALIKS